MIIFRIASKLTLGCRFLGSIRFMVLLALGLMQLGISNDAEAFGSSTAPVVRVYLLCSVGDEGPTTTLKFWWPDEQPDLSRQVCVSEKPVFEGFAVQSIHSKSVTPYDTEVILEFGESSRSAIEQMSGVNKGKQLAIVVNDLVVSLPLLWKAYSDTKFSFSAKPENAKQFLDSLNLQP